MKNQSRSLELITRRDCHLCEEALPRVRWLARLTGRQLFITDIDTRPDLSEFTHRVPVVRIGDRVIAEETVPMSTVWRAL